jgi:hypothetical protein
LRPWRKLCFATARFFAVVDGVLVRVQPTHYRIR